MSAPLWSQYDGLAEQFQRHSEVSSYNAHYDRPAVLAALGEVAGRRLLDAGCGPGWYANVLAERGAEVTAFDASDSMVELARAALGPEARVDRAVMGEVLPYSDGAFDTVLSALAIHYVANLDRVFSEFHRVLGPGGTAVISTSHPTTDWLRKGGSYFQTTLEADTWQLAAGPARIGFWRVSLTELCRAATDAGFVITRLIEPQPALSMAEDFPDTYHKLTREPGFLILGLRRGP